MAMRAVNLKCECDRIKQSPGIDMVACVVVMAVLWNRSNGHSRYIPGKR